VAETPSTTTTAVGWTVGGMDVATVWVADVPAYAKTAPRMHGKAKGGDIAVSKTTGNAATLYVIAR
jgi:hypothetical protein